MNGLTLREIDTLKLAAQGLVKKEIGREQGVGYQTVKNRMVKIREKMDAANEVNAVAIGCLTGLVKPEDLGLE